jgi:hypothetical protein
MNCNVGVITFSISYKLAIDYFKNTSFLALCYTKVTES